MDHYTRPVVAFLTFENEAGYEVGRKYTNEDTVLLECKVDIEEATEPTDIIWENRHFTEEEKNRNLYKVIVSATMYLVGSLVIITAMKGSSMMLTAKYPKADCAIIQKQFGEKLQEFAFYEYLGFYDESKSTDMTGVLQCFCAQDDPSWDMFTKEYFQIDPVTGEKLKEPICSSWYLETQTLKPIIA